MPWSSRWLLPVLPVLLGARPLGAQASLGARAPSGATLLRAAGSGDAAGVRAALAGGTDANVADADGATPLLWAAHAGSVEGVRALLQAGADPRRRGVIWTDTTRTGYYGSPLAAAAGRGHVGVLRLLLAEAKLPVDEPEWDPKTHSLGGWTALQWAAAAGKAAAVEYLVSVGASAERDAAGGADAPLVLAARSGHTTTVRTLLCAAVGATSDIHRLRASAVADSLGDMWLAGALWLTPASACRVLADGDAIRRLRVADVLTAVAAKAIADRQFASARRPAEEALHIREAVLGSEHPHVARQLNQLAEVLREQGDLTTARLLFERALRIREATLPPGHLAVAQVLDNLAGVLRVQGDLAGARRLLERSLRLREAALPPGHLDIAWSLNELAEVLRVQGDLAGARPLHERALGLREAALPPGHPHIALSLNNVAEVLREQGDLAGARPLIERALELYEAARPPMPLNIAVSLNNLALVLQEQGDPAAARPLFERALRLNEAALPAGHPDVAWSVYSLAGVLRAQGDLAGARSLLERVLRLREAALPPAHPDIAYSLNNLAVVLREQGDPVAARALLERALRIREAALPAGHPDIAVSLSNLAETQRAQGDLAGAQPLLERALRLHEAALPPGHPRIAVSLDGLARNVWQTGDGSPDSLLLRASREAQQAAERLLPTLSLAEQRLYLDEFIGIPLWLLLSRAAEHAATGRDDRFLDDAYVSIAAFKGLLLHGLRRQTAFAQLDTSSAHRPGLHQLQALRTNLAAWYQRAGTLPRTEWQAVNDSLTRQKEVLERALARALPAGALDDPWATHGLAGLRRRLPPGAVFVDLYRHAGVERGRYIEPRYTAVLVSRDAGPALVPLGRAARLDSLLARWRAQVLNGGAGTGAAHALAEAAWTPIAAALPAGTRHVWLSPDAQLARLPWNWLATQHEGTQDLLLAHIASARDLTRLLTVQPPTGPATATLVGGVDFGAVRTGSGPVTWPPLPGTTREVNTVTALARADGLALTVLIGAEPTPRAVTAALGPARYVHLATHGFFSRETAAQYEGRGHPRAGVGVDATGTDRVVAARNPLVESGLALAGANAGAAGALTAEELVGLDLRRTRLVVLSACETGRGTEITGQGVMGLRASFGAAGARALIMSLWKVPDESTALLMQHFYRGLWLEDRGPADALRRAQAAVRADPRFAAPVHWAAWVLDGEGWSLR